MLTQIIHHDNWNLTAVYKGFRSIAPLDWIESVSFVDIPQEVIDQLNALQENVQEEVNKILSNYI